MNFDNLHQILRSLYEQMMPLCGDMAGVAKGIAGLGALFYVAYRVWQSLARAEPIDVFPMLRPFAIGLCIMFFPTVVLGTIGLYSSFYQHVMQESAKYGLNPFDVFQELGRRKCIGGQEDMIVEVVHKMADGTL